MNVVHRLTIVGDCPVDGARDIYELTVTTYRMIKVESILEAVTTATDRPDFQEAITTRIKTHLGDGVEVRTVGTHSGVETTVEC